MTKPSTIAQVDLTSANLQSALSRIPPADEAFQRGLTAANLQAGLSNPPASPTTPVPSPSNGTSSRSIVKPE
jgi:hypothetical protein